MNYVMVDYARMFAIGAHGIQTRKYTHEPYWHHLQNVVNILIDYEPTIPQLCAAWLHDVVEDTPITIFQIKEHFGDEIAQYVSDLTEPDKSLGNREVRKDYYNKQLAKASPLVQTIKYADLIDNLSTIEKYDPEFSKIYHHEKRKLLPLIDKGNNKLYKIACNLSVKN